MGKINLGYGTEKVSLGDLPSLRVELEKLSDEEEKKFWESVFKARKAKNTEKLIELRDDYCLRNQMLIRRVIQGIEIKGMDFVDAFQEGYLGLLDAFEDYNPTKGIKFSTYSSYKIYNRITRAIRDRGALVRIPETTFFKYMKYIRYAEEFRNEHNRYPKHSEVKKSLGLSKWQIDLFMNYNFVSSTSLDMPISNDKGQVDTLMSIIKDPLDTEEEIIKKQNFNALIESIYQLPEKYRDVMIMYYGLDGDDALSLSSVGEKIGISKQHVNNIVRRSVKILKEKLAGVS